MNKLDNKILFKTKTHENNFQDKQTNDKKADKTNIEAQKWLVGAQENSAVSNNINPNSQSIAASRNISIIEGVTSLQNPTPLSVEPSAVPGTVVIHPQSSSISIPLHTPTAYITRNTFVIEVENETIQIIKEFAESTSVKDVTDLIKTRINPLIHKLINKKDSLQTLELHLLLNKLVNYNYNRSINDSSLTNIFKKFKTIEINLSTNINLNYVEAHLFDKAYFKYTINSRHFLGIIKLIDILSNKLSKYQFDLIVKSLVLQRLRFCYVGPENSVTVSLSPCVLHFLNHEFDFMDADEIDDFLIKKINFSCTPNAGSSKFEKLAVSGLYLTLLSYNHQNLLMKIGENLLVKHKGNIRAILDNLERNGYEEHSSHITSTLKKKFIRGSEICEPGTPAIKYNYYLEKLKTNNLEDLFLISIEDISDFINNIRGLSYELKEIGCVSEAEQIENSCLLHDIMKQFHCHLNFAREKNPSNFNKNDVQTAFNKIKDEISKNKFISRELTVYINNLLLFIQDGNGFGYHTDLFETIFSVKFPFSSLEKFANKVHSVLYGHTNNSIHSRNFIDIAFNIRAIVYKLTDLSKKNILKKIEAEAYKWQRCGYDVAPIIEPIKQLGFAKDELLFERTNLPLQLVTFHLPARLFDLNENELIDLNKHITNYFPINREYSYKLTIATLHNKFKKYKNVYKNTVFFSTGIKISEAGSKDIYLQTYPDDPEKLYIAFNFNELNLLEQNFNNLNRSFFVHTLLLFAFLTNSKQNILLLTYLKMLKNELVNDKLNFAEWLNAKFSAIFYDGATNRGDLKEKSYSWLEIIHEFKNPWENLPDGSPNYDDIELLETFLDKEAKTADLPKPETDLLIKLLKGYPSPFFFHDSEVENTQNDASIEYRDPLKVVETHLQTYGGTITNYPPIQAIENIAVNVLPDTSVDPLEEMIKNTQPLDPFLERFETISSQQTVSSLQEDSDTEMADFAMELEEALLASSSSDESVEQVENLSPFRSNTKQHVHIARKYLRTEKTYMPFLGGKKETHPQDIRDKVKYQFNSLNDVASIGAANVYPKEILTSGELFKGTYFTLDPSLDFNRQSRFTFVRAGRQLKALMPTENENGRVVLVVTEAEESEMKKKLSSHCDILVIKEFPQMGIKAHDERLKLPSLRMLAAISFAYDKGLKNLIFMDDNIEAVCADEILPLDSSWQEVYECFRMSAAQEDYACLSPQTFRPEHKNVTVDNVRISKGNFGYKLYYLDIDMLQQAIDNPRYLIPQNVKLWGEDIFFQIHLQIAQLSAGSIDRESLVIARSQKNKNSCTREVTKAEDWLDPSSKEGLDKAPESYRIAFERMVGIVQKNVDDNKRHEETKVPQRDLTHDTHQIFNNVSATKGSKRIVVEAEKKENKPNRIQLALPETIVPVSEDFRLALVKSTENILQRAEAASLRTVQIEALEKFLQFSSNPENNPQAYFNMATGVGKSLLFLLLSMEVSKQMTAFNAQNKQEAKRHVLIIVPEIQLSTQTYKGFSEHAAKLGFDYASRCIIVNSASIPHTLFGKNDRFKRAKDNIVIMCAASASRYFSNHPAELNLFGLTIVDEFHSVPKNLLKLFNGYSRQSGAYLLGFSATPTKEKIPFFGTELYRFGAHEGVRDKYLAPWVIDTLDCDYSPENYELLIKDLPDILAKRQHVQGDALSNNQGIIYLPSIPDADSVHDQLKKKSIRSKVIHSGEDAKKRHERLQKFEAGKAKLLLAVNMLKQGVNLPDADYAIVAQDTKSEEDFVQKCGRLLRLTAAKPNKIANLIVFRNVFGKLHIPREKAYCGIKEIADKVSRAYLEQKSNYTFIKINQQISIKPNAAKRSAENELSGLTKQHRTGASSGSNTSKPVVAQGEFHRTDLMTIPIPKEGGKALAENLGVFLIAQQNDEQINHKVGRICGILKKPGGDSLEQAVREGNLQKSNHPLAQQLDSLLTSLYQEASKGKGNRIEYTVKSFTLMGEKFIPVESLKERNPPGVPTVRLYRRAGTEQLNEVHYDLLVRSKNRKVREASEENAKKV